uniref:Immunoglobulin V-set domain-containing protein n=2 Tax=Cyprinus carpio TaxID=7962 RepID=A0A8C1B5G4_CYPCA
ISVFFKKVILLLPGFSFSYKVDQSPAEVIKRRGESAEIRCSHSVPSYNQISLYSALNLIGYVLYKNSATESQYTSQFNITGDGAKSSTLDFMPEASGRSVTYYCAASKAQC